MPSTPFVRREALQEIEFHNALFSKTMNQKNRQGEKETDMEIGFFVYVKTINFFMLAV
jgi:hypothetical protein